MDTPKAVWLDCDPGHDDAIAIIVAGYEQKLRLLGISTIGGNQSVDKITTNALLVLEAAGLEDVDVVQGQSTPLIRAPKLCPEIHGETGLDRKEGGHIFGSAAPKKHPVAGKAVNVMYEAISSEFSKSKEKITLIFTGALTNGAVLFIVYPEVKEMVDVVLMGGCMGLGNTGPVMEFNIQTDPEAAKSVFESGVNLTMVPLEVTHTVLTTTEVLARLKGEKLTPFRQAVADIVTFFAETYRDVFLFDDPPMHDPCAVVYVSHPHLFEVKPLRVEIETASPLSSGQTVCDVWGFFGKPPNCNVAMKVDVPKLWNVVIDAVSRADQKSPLNRTRP
ncbi:hypothetical protein BSKO_00807 [Bryopsis sp. KO-2023]|nr:hypothetical protein BSKO_00807 [Bryopsis sp. KO-2023]